ncbi:MAG: tetratricopeptide repeat protein, partial [Opitutus sp.]
ALRRRPVYYAGLAATWLLLAWLVLGGAGSRGVAAGVGLGVSSSDYLLTQARALAVYLKLSVWPYPLVLDYGTALDRQLSQVWWQGLLVVTLLIGTVWALARRPALGFLGAWFFLMLAPSSSVVPLVTQTIAEHRMYLPLASVVVLLALLAFRTLRSKAVWLGALLTLVCAGLTIARNRDYVEPMRLWADSVKHYPGSARAQNNLGIELERSGKRRDAIERFARAATLDPSYASPHYNWGLALLADGATRDAIAQLETAVTLAPAHADAHLALGNAFVRVGAVAEALPHYEAALDATPGADVHYNLGVALVALSRDSDARIHFIAALQFDPSLAEAQFQLARIAERAGQADEARRLLGETLRLAPEHLGAHRRLGLAAARAEQFEEAAQHFSVIVRVAPTDADAWANLGNTFLARNQPQAAIEHYERALQLRPDDRRSIENLRLAREALSGR